MRSARYNIFIEIGYQTNLRSTLTAYLKKMKLNDDANEYDLMMLWNFKKPKLKKTITKPENET